MTEKDLKMVGKMKLADKDYKMAIIYIYMLKDLREKTSPLKKQIGNLII